MAGRLGWLVALALVLSVGLPTAVGSHCDTKINVYGRISLMPVAPPPYSSSTAGVCVRVLNGTAVDEHVLPPNTDQVMVRVAGDFGPSVPAIDAEFDGLGFVDMHYPLLRTSNPAGGYTYNLAEWLDLPNGLSEGDLTVTITQPGGIKRSVTYSTTTNVVAPPIPPA